MQPLRLCICLAFVAVLRASGPSEKVLDFVSYVVGDYDNKEQIQKAGDDHPLSQVRVIPVDIPCLRPDPVLFIEEAVNGTIRVFVVAVIKDGIEDTVTEILYNFTDYTNYKPGEYQVENLSNISCGDLHGAKDCNASFGVSREGFVFGSFPQCLKTVNKEHPRFTVMFTCDSLSFSASLYTGQPSTIDPYELKLTSKKYPLINAPNDYVSPCGN